MNNLRKCLMLIIFSTALLVTPAILMTTGVFSFGGAAQPFIIVALFLVAFAIPCFMPAPQFDSDELSNQHDRKSK